MYAIVSKTIRLVRKITMSLRLSSDGTQITLGKFSCAGCV